MLPRGVVVILMWTVLSLSTTLARHHRSSHRRYRGPHRCCPVSSLQWSVQLPLPRFMRRSLPAEEDCPARDEAAARVQVPGTAHHMSPG